MNHISEQKITISSLGKSIIKTLAYYDIFDYPLKAEEIYYNLGTNSVSLTEIENEVEQLCKIGITFNKNKISRPKKAALEGLNKMKLL